MKNWKLLVLLVVGALLLVGGCQCGSDETTTGEETTPAAGGTAALTGSASFTVTDCKEERGAYTVTINNSLVISDIKYADGQMELPFSSSRGGNRYEVIEATGADGETLLKDIEAAVAAVAGGGSVPAPASAEFAPLKVDGIEVRIVQPRETSGSSSSSSAGSRSGSSSRSSGSSASAGSGTTRAPLIFVAMEINDNIKLSNFSIRQDRNDPNSYSIYWPSRKAGTKWVTQVDISNDADKQALEQAVFKAFLAEAGLDEATTKLVRRGEGGEGADAADRPEAALPHISAIKKDGATYTATLWNEVIVHGIKVEGGEVTMPGSTDRQGKVRPDLTGPFRMADNAVKLLQAAVAAFAENGQWEKGTAAACAVTDVHATVNRSGSGGFATATFNGSICVNNFRVTDQNGQVKIFLPADRQGEQFANRVEFKTPAFWTALQAKIVDAYQAAKQRAAERGDSGSSSGGSRSGSSRGSRSSGGAASEE